MRGPWTRPARRGWQRGSGTPGGAALLALVKGADGLDLIGAQLELEGREVLDDPPGGDGLGEHQARLTPAKHLELRVPRASAEHRSGPRSEKHAPELQSRG